MAYDKLRCKFDEDIQDSTLPSPMASGRLWQTLTGMSEFHLEFTGMVETVDSIRIQVEFPSTRFQVHSPGFQGSFRWILRAIPTHSKFIPPDSNSHSNTFQFQSTRFQYMPRAIQMSCNLAWPFSDNLILKIPCGIYFDQWKVKCIIENSYLSLFYTIEL